ncbi:AI-2E family transporter [Thiocystis violascens]|uniref:Putative permease n=1 Tax=Thiocystis violascens (strain ATCC 17096 / DSM 198 / 6111) TaxID=765911 RepID=I3YEU5_THIV6|nr:AI-2E family transporter [Thiocystis violascens]AFL75513.1 putative permease [Thiocystis violascens DSM 198]
MPQQNTFVANALEATVRIGLLLVLAAWCFSIVQPFVIPLAWGIIIAVAQYPGYRTLCAWLGGRRRAAATLMAVLDLLVLLVPAVLLSGTLLDGAQGLARGLQEGTLAVPPPPDSVKGWPLVGEPLSAFWVQASQNLTETAAKLAPQLKAAAGWLLSTAVGAGFSVLQFILAIIIAGALLAHADASAEFARAVAARLAGEKGAEITRLSETIVRSVTKGILGVALAQAILAGVGFMVMGIPAAGLWALLCLLLSTVQIGIFPITLPILIYVFATADTVPAVLFLVWSLMVGSLDNVLKPLVLGRGVQVPMAVIFVGAIGGFIASGIIGLFVGAVVLALGYKLLLAWVYERPEGSAV